MARSVASIDPIGASARPAMSQPPKIGEKDDKRNEDRRGNRNRMKRGGYVTEFVADLHVRGR